MFGPFVVGDEVEARLRGKHHWYPAVVVHIDVEGLGEEGWRYSISYTDGEKYLSVTLILNRPIETTVAHV